MPNPIKANAAGGQTLYRLLDADLPKPRDFESNHDKGRAAPDWLPHVMHCGLSMFEQPGQAARMSRRSPTIVAAVTLPDNLGLTLARTLSEGHFTVWGHAETLMRQATVVDQ